MSTIRISTPLLAIKPRVRFCNSVLTARASLFMRAVSLFAYDRYLRVDTKRQLVWFLARRYWLVSTIDVVPFRRTKYVVYKYRRLPTSFGFVPNVEATDSIGWFEVALAIEGRAEPLKLFRFAGEGSEMTGLVGAIFGDTLIDLEGDQEIASRNFITQLARLLGIPLRTELDQKVSDIVAPHTILCPNCGRRVSPSVQRCIYCAKPLRSSVHGDA